MTSRLVMALGFIVGGCFGQFFMWPSGYIDPSQASFSGSVSPHHFAVSMSDSCDLNGSPMATQAGSHPVMSLTVEIDTSTLPYGYDPTNGYVWIYAWISVGQANAQPSMFGLVDTSGVGILWMVPVSVVYGGAAVPTWQPDQQHSEIVNLDSVCLAVLSMQPVAIPIVATIQSIVCIPTMWNDYVGSATTPISVIIG